jgi:hypothetical protein
MESPTDFDITDYSFDEFVSFVFAHDVAAEHETQWYWKAPDVTFAPQQVCAYYVRLFRNPEFLLERFSKPHLEQGFWAIFSGIDWGLEKLLWETEIPFPQRKECVTAMFDLFSRFFATEPLEDSCFMWWDALCYDWHSECWGTTTNPRQTPEHCVPVLQWHRLAFLRTQSGGYASARLRFKRRAISG